MELTDYSRAALAFGHAATPLGVASGNLDVVKTGAALSAGGLAPLSLGGVRAASRTERRCPARASRLRATRAEFGPAISRRADPARCDIPPLHREIYCTPRVHSSLDLLSAEISSF